LRAERARAERRRGGPAARAERRRAEAASFGDPVALAKGLMLYLQAFDYQSARKSPTAT